MEKVRVHQIAKQLGLSSNELMQKLDEQGFSVKSNLSSIDHDMAQLILETLAPSKEELKPPPKKDEEIPLAEKVEAKVEAKQILKLPENLTVRELSEKLNLPTNEVIKTSISLGIMVAANQVLKNEEVVKIVEKYNFVVEFEKSEELTEKAEPEKIKEVINEADLEPRIPVVTIMGHVDHGKTLLLDAIRKSDLVSREKGGITQHIGAYKVKTKEGSIVFLDTPGHEAFTAIRARGSKITDIVVLVVAADDGVMPQTIEAINHAKAANVPIIVAINKIDLSTADPLRVKKELMKYDLIPEEWGGKTIFVETSAKTKHGLQDLLEMILLEAEMLDLKANPKINAKGIIIEAKLDRRRGPVGTVLIQEGILKIGNTFISGNYCGKVKALISDQGYPLKSAEPSTPVEVLGFPVVPRSGDKFEVLPEKEARQIEQERQIKLKLASFQKRDKLTLDKLYKQIKESEVKELPLILKADVQGSMEALVGALEKLNILSKEIKLRILHSSIGSITESDVMLAAASGATILGFTVHTEPTSREIAEREGIEIRNYDIIYHLLEDVQKAMEGMLQPLLEEKDLGKAEVRDLFSIPKIGVIAGSHILAGKIVRNCQVRLFRNKDLIYEGTLSSLKRFKEDVKEVSSGYECGIGLKDFQNIEIGDIIEAFEYEEVVAKL